AVPSRGAAAARIDLLVPERDYYAQKEPLERLRADSTPGIFDRLGVTPKAEMFKDVVLWDAFLTATVTAMIRQARPNLLLVHFVQTDYFQHRVGREGAETKAAVARVDAHVGAIRRALAEAGLADRSVIIVTGDHGFEDARRGVHPNALLARAGLRGCPGSLIVSGSGGQHGYLPSHPRMPTGFIATGAGVRAGVALERVRLVDIAPTAARLLGLTTPDVEGRVLGEILERVDEISATFPRWCFTASPLW